MNSSAKGIAPLILITGVGVRESRRTFTQPDPATPVLWNGKTYKLNAAAGTAIVLAEAGYRVFMCSESEDALAIVSERTKGTALACYCDLSKRSEVDRVSRDVIALCTKEGRQLHLVHYAGVSGKNLDLPKGTVALSPWEAPAESYAPIVGANIEPIVNLLQALQPHLATQEMTKLIFLTAISAVRTKRLHALDAVQKFAIHALARSFALDLTKERIYVTEIMPGITDTGFYDDEITFDAMIQSSQDFGYDYTQETYPVFKAEKVGEAVRFALDINAHVRELTVMPYGQYPHLGA